jgi:signal peptidase I
VFIFLLSGSFVAVLALLLARRFLVVVSVEQESMAPALHHGDRVLACRHWPQRWLRKGQVVLLQPQQSQTIRKPVHPPVFIKRLVGMPGETFVTHLAELDEHKRPQFRHIYDSAGNRTFHLASTHCFVQGDSLYSTDSRDWGPIPLSSIVGVMVAKFPYQETRQATSAHIEDEIGPRLGQPAPPFTAQTPGGQPVSPSALFGQEVILVFLNLALPRCQALWSEIAAGQYPSEQARDFLILLDRKDEAEAKKLLPTIPAGRFTLAFLPDSTSLQRDYHFRQAPFFCDVDAAGKVRSSGYFLSEYWNLISGREHD